MCAEMRDKPYFFIRPYQYRGGCRNFGTGGIPPMRMPKAWEKNEKFFVPKVCKK